MNQLVNKEQKKHKISQLRCLSLFVTGCYKGPHTFSGTHIENLYNHIGMS